MTQATTGITPAMRRLFLEQMLVARAVDEEALLLRKQGLVDLWAPCCGQEALQVGAAYALEGVLVVPSYREIAVALIRGATPAQVVAGWSGRTFCGWQPRQLQMFPFTLVLASQMLPAVGYALGTRIQGREEPVAVFFGDGASSEGDASEAFNLAAVEQARVLFLNVNNGWAISKPTCEQMRTSIAERAAGFGIASRQVDGRDPEVVFEAVATELRLLSTEPGPRLIEFSVDRILSHTSSDTQEIYRDEADIAAAVSRDPVVAYRRRLLEDGTVDQDWLADIERRTRDLRADLLKEYSR